MADRIGGYRRLPEQEEQEEEEEEEEAKVKKKTKKEEEEEEEATAAAPYRWALRAASQRRTWVGLFLAAYAVLLAACWRLLHCVSSWYDSQSAVPSAGPWPALYASALFGGLFGLLSMAAALAVAVPAMVVTWITVLVLLACAGKPRQALVREGRRATADIAGIALKVLVREGKLVAAVCAVVSFFALLYRRRHLHLPPPNSS